jgi:hypothetical protein
MDTFDASYTSVSETQTATDTSLNFRTSRSSRSGNQAGALVVWHPAVDAASRLQQYYEQLITVRTSFLYLVGLMRTLMIRVDRLAPRTMACFSALLKHRLRWPNSCYRI